METTVKSIFALAIAMLALLFTSIARGAETTLVIDLQKKIKSDFTKMELVTKQQETKAEKLNDDIKQIVTKLTNTTDEGKKEELRNQYFKKRAEHLHAEATKVVEIESALGRIIRNTAALENEFRKGDKQSLIPSDAAPVKDTLKGMANILAPLQALKGDDPKVATAIMTLRNLDMQYKTYFTPGKRTSLREQQEYLEDLYAMVHSVRSLLQYETAYLKSNVFYLMKDGIVKVINDFQKHFYSTTFKGFENHHALDEEVIGENNNIETGMHQNTFDLKTVGNW